MFFRRRPSEVLLDAALESLAAGSIRQALKAQAQYGSNAGWVKQGTETEDDIRKLEHTMRMTIETFIGKVEKIADSAIAESTSSSIEELRRRNERGRGNPR